MSGRLPRRLLQPLRAAQARRKCGAATQAFAALDKEAEATLPAALDLSKHLVCQAGALTRGAESFADAAMGVDCMTVATDAMRAARSAPPPPAPPAPPRWRSFPARLAPTGTPQRAAADVSPGLRQAAQAAHQARAAAAGRSRGPAPCPSWAHPAHSWGRVL